MLQCPQVSILRVDNIGALGARGKDVTRFRVRAPYPSQVISSILPYGEELGPGVS